MRVRTPQCCLCEQMATKTVCRRVRRSLSAPPAACGLPTVATRAKHARLRLCGLLRCAHAPGCGTAGAVRPAAPARPPPRADARAVALLGTQFACRARTGYVESLWPAADELLLPPLLRTSDSFSASADALLGPDFDFGDFGAPSDDEFVRLLLDGRSAARPACGPLPRLPSETAPRTAPASRRTASKPPTPEKANECRVQVRQPRRAQPAASQRVGLHVVWRLPTHARLAARQKSDRRYWSPEERARFHEAMRRCVKRARASSCARCLFPQVANTLSGTRRTPCRTRGTRTAPRLARNGGGSGAARVLCAFCPGVNSPQLP